MASIELERPTRFGLLRNRPLMTLMLGHFTVDTYAGLLPVLYPLLIERFQLSLSTVGIVTLAYIGASSLSQPFFGWLADRTSTRLIGLTLMWTAAMFALLGLASSFEMVVVCAAAAGIGSGAYHPFGALNASAVIPANQRNIAMSVYVTGGTLGVALGPLIGAIIFSLFGMAGTVVMLLPGVAIGFLLIRLLGTGVQRQAHESHAAPGNTRIPIAALLAIIGVMMSRSWTIYGLETFTPTWYKSLGYSAVFYGPLATTLVLASAIGTVGCGSLADRFGRRAVIIGSLILTIPAILLFAWYPGPFGFISGALVGLSAASTGPLMLVMAQQLMVGRAGMASGLILGIGFISGAIGVPVMGMLADAYGMQFAIETQVLVVVATIGLALLLPSEARMARLARS